MMMSFYQIKDNKLFLSIYLQPNATKDEIVGEFNQALKIRIKAAPIEGKANEHLIHFLAKILEIPKSHIRFIKGEAQRYKKICIFPIPQNYHDKIKFY